MTRNGSQRRKDINELRISGHLTRDASPLRKTKANGELICFFRIAVMGARIGFFDVIAFEEIAELAATLKKGQRVEIEEGSLSWLEGKKDGKGEQVNVVATKLRVVEEGADAEPEAEDSTSAVNATPGAEKLAKDNGVDLSEVDGTGKEGRVTKKDVEKHVS